MTKVTLYSSLLDLGAGRPSLLPPDWWWWQLRLPAAGGELFEQVVSDLDEDQYRSVSFVFNDGSNLEIRNPPAFYVEVTDVRDEFRLWGGEPLLTQRVRTHGIAEVVWRDKPGPLWRQMPGNTCMWGEYRTEYRTEELGRRVGPVRSRDSERVEYTKYASIEGRDPMERARQQLENVLIAYAELAKPKPEAPNARAIDFDQPGPIADRTSTGRQIEL